MADIAGLLERKRKLLEQKQIAKTRQLDELERELAQIDQTLTGLEGGLGWKHAPPSAPH